MTSLGRLIFFDQPGTGASDPVTSGALPTLEQWADSITAVLDDLGSREAVLVAVERRVRGQRRCSRRHIRRAPPRWSCLEGYADPWPNALMESMPRKSRCLVAMWGTGELQHVVNPDMPWNEEIRAAWARHERLAASPRDARSHDASRVRIGRAGGPPDNPRANPRRPPRRRPVHPAREGQVRRRAHTRREIC